MTQIAEICDGWHALSGAKGVVNLVNARHAHPVGLGVPHAVRVAGSRL